MRRSDAIATFYEHLLSSSRETVSSRSVDRAPREGRLLAWLKRANVRVFIVEVKRVDSLAKRGKGIRGVVDAEKINAGTEHDVQKRRTRQPTRLTQDTAFTVVLIYSAARISIRARACDLYSRKRENILRRY